MMVRIIAVDCFDTLTWLVHSELASRCPANDNSGLAAAAGL